MIVVVGCGNPNRLDDGAGLEVLRLLNARGAGRDARRVRLLDAGTELLKAADPKNKADLAKTLSTFKVTTAVGVVNWGKGPVPNVFPTPLIGAQWIKAKPGSKYKLDLVIVDNADDPNVPIGAKLQPYS